jgi:pyruvate dehydrogenase E1 component alpha subunit
MHTTADDPTKYRSQEEVAEWERKDPLTRFAAYLSRKGIRTEGLEAELDAEIAAAVQRFEATATADPLAMFEHVYGELPPDLKLQREELAARLAGNEPQGDSASHEASPPMRGQRTGRR